MARALTYATLFIGLLLVFLPARVLSTSGIRGPAAIGIVQVGGLVLGAAGGALALWCVLTFVVVGRGTPAPFDPPRRLVVQGPYGILRNPMYLGAGLALAAAALFYQSPALLVYAAGFLLAAHLLVVWYEEPTLRRTFGPAYEDYRRRVPRWRPRFPTPGPHAKRYALAFLLSGLTLAVATPAYVAHAAPHLAGYLLHPTLFLWQAAPYVLCGALWLPWSHARTGTATFILSLLLLLAALIIYVPMLRAPGAGGGDMAGFAFVVISVATMVAILVGSAVALVTQRLGRRATGS